MAWRLETQREGVLARVMMLDGSAIHRLEDRMSLPDQMIDRWENRPEPPPGGGVVSWHMLMRDHPEVVYLARQAQQRLAGFDGLHMTPLAWLHIRPAPIAARCLWGEDEVARRCRRRRGLRGAR